jgi:steroid delta-isomerase-like uncharacterized protein
MPSDIAPASGDPLKERVRRLLLGVWNEGQLDVIDELLTEDYVRRTRGSGQHSRDDLREAARRIREAFPDLQLSVGNMLREGDTVVSHWESRGTHQRELYGVPPTGELVTLSGITVSTFRGDRVDSEWVTWDPSDMVDLLGVIPIAGSPGLSPYLSAVGSCDAEALKAVHRKFGTGVTIVSAATADEPRGLVVNAFASISLSPPLILVAVNRNAATHEFLYRSRFLAVNVLAADQAELGRRFATPIPDKFSGVDWFPGQNGAPVIRGTAAVLEALIEQRATSSTHTVFIARVTKAEASAKSPLLYLDGEFFDAAALTAGQTHIRRVDSER